MYYGKNIPSSNSYINHRILFLTVFALVANLELIAIKLISMQITASTCALREHFLEHPERSLPHIGTTLNNLR